MFPRGLSGPASPLRPANRRLPLERARQIGNKTCSARTCYTYTFASDPTLATESQIALGLRKAFGQENAGYRALCALYRVTAQPTQSGAQRLLALAQREEQAR